MNEPRTLYSIDPDDLKVLKTYLDEPCRFDHHGYCQSHALTDGKDGLCAIGRVLGVMPVTVDDLNLEAIERAARAWAETIVGGSEVDQLAGDPLATEQALKVLRAALGGTDE